MGPIVRKLPKFPKLPVTKASVFLWFEDHLDDRNSFELMQFWKKKKVTKVTEVTSYQVSSKFGNFSKVTKVPKVTSYQGICSPLIWRPSWRQEFFQVHAILKKKKVTKVTEVTSYQVSSKFGNLSSYPNYQLLRHFFKKGCGTYRFQRFQS